MSTFTLGLSARGILAQLPDGLVNQELFSAVVDPTVGLLAQITHSEQFELHARLGRNDRGSIEIEIPQFLFSGLDLRLTKVVDFLSWVGHMRARQFIAGKLDIATAKYLVAGIDVVGQLVYGFVAVTVHPAFVHAFAPDIPAAIDPWLLYTQLALERTMGPRFAEALQHVQRRIGPSLVRVMNDPNLPIAEVVAELQQHYNVSKDSAAAMLQLGDWHAAGGLAKLERVRALAASQG